ncbi:uncharacterized protein [Epargyreus clarus]|uniref:uncharacterized protein n=1 Tax=Epargyreus clarus TaxID=520877 RepID=UPI003C2E5E90
METYEDIYKTICRLCLLRGDSNNMVPLIDSNSNDSLSAYGRAVKTFAHISIHKDDCFPKMMCANCLFVLKQAIHFKFKCESSETELKNVVKSASNLEVFKVRLIENIMFRQIFPEVSSETRLDCSKRTKIDKKKVKNIETSHSVPDNAINSCDDDYNFDESEKPTKSEDENDNLLQTLENIVASNSTCIDSDYKRVKRKKRLSILKMRTKKKKVRKQSQKLVCHICDKVLANQNTYHYHMQRHNGFRYICEHCGKGFPILTELQAHQVSRHGTGPFLQCQHCSFKAPRKFDLVEHERLHTGERPFACDKCGLTFRRRGIWKKHLIYHSEKKIQCNQCPRKFHQRSDMLAHSNNVHQRVYVYCCSKCGATYAKTATVRRHMTEKHGIPREMQGKIIRINKGGHEQ